MFLRSYPALNVFLASEKYMDLKHFYSQIKQIREKRCYFFEIYSFRDDFKELKYKFTFCIYKIDNKIKWKLDWKEYFYKNKKRTEVCGSRTINSPEYFSEDGFVYNFRDIVFNDSLLRKIYAS